MILAKNNIPKDTDHFIKLESKIFIPDYIIKLPLTDKENLELENVDCIFSIVDFPSIALKVIGIESFDKINSQSLNNKSFGQYLPEYIYVFNQGILDLDKTKSKYLK